MATRTGTEEAPARRWSRHFTPTTAHRGLGLACLEVGQQNAAPDGSRNRVLSCHAAVLLLRGRTTLTWGDPPASRDVTAPSIFWLFPGVPHTYEPDRHGWSEMWALFDGTALAAYEQLGYLVRGKPVAPLASSGPVIEVFHRLLDVCLREEANVEVQAATVIHELITTAGRHEHVANARANSDSDVLATLRAHALSPLPMDQHARQVGLTPGALRQTVRRSAGCAPKEYILRVRMNHAKKLLAHTALAVTEIARRVGYDDPAYFTRIFTQRAGLSPRAFRRSGTLHG